MADERLVTVYLNPKLDTLQGVIDKLTRQLKGVTGVETYIIIQPGTKKELARRTPDGQWSISNS